MSDVRILHGLRERVLDDNESLAGLLRTTLALGAITRSERLRTWASQELKGYDDTGTDVPPYRQLYLPMYCDSVSGNYWTKGQSLSKVQLPPDLREYIPDAVDFRQSIEELTRMSEGDGGSQRIGMAGFPVLAAAWSRQLPMFQAVHDIYYQVSRSALAGIVGMVRTTLVEMVVDMTQDVPLDSMPTRGQVDSAVQVHVHGSRDRYELNVENNSGIIGQGPGSVQTQNNTDVTDAISRMRGALHEVADIDDRADVEQAINDFEDAATQDNPDPETVRRRSRALTRVTSAVGGALLSAAASEGAQAAVDALGSMMG